MAVRTLVVLLTIVAAASITISSSAQQNSALVTSDEIGLPELQVTVTEDGWEFESEVAAGRYLVTVDNTGVSEVGTTAFVRLPDGWSIESLAELLVGQDARSTPQASDGTNVSEDDTNLEDWIYQFTFAGGISAPAGETAQGIIDLFPGTWAIWSDNESKSPAPLLITGTMPTDLVTPETNATITQVNNDDVHGLELSGTLQTGRNIIQVVNASDAPHLIEFVGLTSQLDRDQVLGLMLTPEGESADPGLGIPADLQLIFGQPYAATQSPGTIQWMIAEFAPGDYVAACWIPERDNPDVTHAEQGQFILVSIE